MSMAGSMSAVVDYLDALLDDTPAATTGALAWAGNAGDCAAANVPVPVPLPVPTPEWNAALPADASPAAIATTATPTTAWFDPPAPSEPVVADAVAPPSVPILPVAPRAAASPTAPAVYQPATDTRAAPSAVSHTHRWVRVTVGADSYALELLRVQEVVRLAPIVALRGAAPAVLGAMNLRGRIVPVFDLGLWLDAGHVDPDARSRIVVVERDDELIGVLVSAVDDVVTLGRDRIEPPLPGSDPGAILGIARVGPTPTVLLDADAFYG